MSNDNEIKFRDDLYQKYAKGPKILISRDVYNSRIDELKLISENTLSKSRHEYYILNK